MKIKIRTLKNEKYELEVSPEQTVDQLKEIIENQYKYEKASQTLIFAGKVLPSNKTLEELKIAPEDFLVLMVKTKKPESAPSTTTITNQVPSTSTSNESVSNTSPNPETVPSSSDVVPTDTILTGAELEKAITDIMEMGFTRPQVVTAMSASFNHKARAIEYLTSNNIPSRPQPSTSAPVRSPTTSSTGVFDGLRQHPQFPQLCLLAQQGGEDALKQILTYFSEVSRPLIDLIMQHQEEFINLLNTPITPLQNNLSPSLTTPGPIPTGPGVIRVQVTPEDERVISGLVSMGFDRNRVLEAYFLFDKDETMTANFLLNNPEGDMGQ